MPKLTLRDLFAVVTIVALALGWWLDHRRQLASRRELLANVHALKFQLDEVQGGADNLRTCTLNSDGSVTITFVPDAP